ncbi:MAG: 30S ribosomal protein S7, partial [Gammaproteobacteria bacterium]
MSRRKQADKRSILPDPKFGSERLAKFVNMVMKSGKKAVAERIVYGALDQIGGKRGGDPIEVLDRALDNVRPMVEVKSRRVGGATYQVPVEVRATRQQALAMRWIIESARARTEKSMPMRLANELMEASE